MKAQEWKWRQLRKKRKFLTVKLKGYQREIPPLEQVEE
jgi:hypothetical protein